MSIIYYDICSIPLFLMILFICYSRKMTKGAANQLFIILVFLSLFSALSDLAMEITSNMAPLTETEVFLCKISTYSYLAIRNSNNAVLLLFLLALTRTTFLLRKRWAKIAFWLPYACVLAMLAQNPFTQTVFTVTAENGYARGPLILVLYAIALIYGLGGLAYCIYCRRYLPLGKWGALLSLYILGHVAVVIQFFYPEMLVEMYFTAVAEMQIMLTIMRPEERMDTEAGVLSWASYQTDLKNIILSGEHVKIVVIRMQNSPGIRHHLGDYAYSKYISEIANGIRSIPWTYPNRVELYYERPDTLYLVIDADEKGTGDIKELLLSGTRESTRSYKERGIRFEPYICVINCPEDLKSADDIIKLGHIFLKFNDESKSVLFAEDIVSSKTFAIEAHIEEILDRAIRNDYLEMYYQPIYDVHTGAFRSAEALARIIDPEYGLISPAIFIPAAEQHGYMVPLGDLVLDHVFSFVSNNDMDALGIDFIEVNLSVAQCVVSGLADRIFKLKEKYGVDPGRINMEITELNFENINDIIMENINKLIEMGFNFAMDDYGIGYSNIQRISNIPFKIIKIDKSMLDEVFTDSGKKIMEYTIRMLQSIGKCLVTEGAETLDEVDILKKMDCDYIQGFYFSKPLPSAEFISFIEENKNKKA